jgi:hypothetical protein
MVGGLNFRVSKGGKWTSVFPLRRVGKTSVDVKWVTGKCQCVLKAQNINLEQKQKSHNRRSPLVRQTFNYNFNMEKQQEVFLREKNSEKF